MLLFGLILHSILLYECWKKVILVTPSGLPLFRRLCILKGVFPREPKKKVKGNHHSYYHMKDIMFLKHEPLLEKFRDMRAYERKVKKAMSKKNRDLAERLLTRKPTYTLDMLIKERWGSALRVGFNCGFVLLVAVFLTISARILGIRNSLMH